MGKNNEWQSIQKSDLMCVVVLHIFTSLNKNAATTYDLYFSDLQGTTKGHKLSVELVLVVLFLC